MRPAHAPRGEREWRGKPAGADPEKRRGVTLKTDTLAPIGPERRVLVGSTRLVVPDVDWSVYETWVDSLPERSPIRMAFDGSNLEIMTKSRDHEKYRQLLGYAVFEIAKVLDLPLGSYGEMTWKRPAIGRGIEADQCYYVELEKIEAAAKIKGKHAARRMPPPRPGHRDRHLAPGSRPAGDLCGYEGRRAMAFRRRKARDRTPWPRWSLQAGSG